MKREPAWRIGLVLALQALALVLVLAILARCAGLLPGGAS
jgi:hypothetical protein